MAQCETQTHTTTREADPVLSSQTSLVLETKEPSLETRLADLSIPVSLTRYSHYCAFDGERYKRYSPISVSDVKAIYMPRVQGVHLLRHPNILQFGAMTSFSLYGPHIDPEAKSVRVEYITEKYDTTLRNALKGAVTDAQRFNWAADLTRAVTHLHALNPPFVHTTIADVTCVLVGDVLKLADMGTMQAYNVLDLDSDPAVLRDKTKTPASSDVYAMGAVLMSIFGGGERPWEGLSHAEYSKEQVHNRKLPPQLAKLHGRVPDRLFALIAKCMEYEAKDRCTAAEAYKELCEIGAEYIDEKAHTVMPQSVVDLRAAIDEWYTDSKNATK